MDEVRVLLGVLTGLWFLRPDISLGTLVPTGVVIHLTNAIVGSYFAANRGRPKRLWFVLCLVFGVWALAAFFLLPKRPALGRAP